MKNETKNAGAETVAEEKGYTTQEAAQSARFHGKELSADELRRWITRDIQSAVSLLITVVKDDYLMGIIGDYYYNEYVAHLHVEEKEK